MKRASVLASADARPATPESMMKTVKLQYNTGQYKDAVETMQHMLETPALHPENGLSGNFYRWKGYSHFQLYKKNDSNQDLENALSCYRLAIDELNFFDPDVLCEAADVYRRHDAHEGALLLYGTVLEHFPMYKYSAKAAMGAVCCMFRTGHLAQANEYLFWLVDAPMEQVRVPEDILYLLSARVYELIDRGDLAMIGYEDLFQKKKKDGATQGHENWSTWRDDAELWRQCCELFLDLEMYELLDHCMAQSFRCSALHTNSFFAHWAVVNTKLGDNKTGEKHLRSIMKGQFVRDACDSKRKILTTAELQEKDTWGKPLEGEQLDILNIIEGSDFLAQYIQNRAHNSDLEAKQTMERENMMKAEVETKWFLTELKIWNAGISICKGCRGHLARRYRRRAYRCILLYQCLWRGHKARERVANLRANRRIITVGRVLIRQFNVWRIANAKWKLMAVAAQSIVGDRWQRRAALYRIKQASFSHVCQQKIRKAIVREKERRAACFIQRLFRNRMMKELMKMISTRVPSELIFRLFYRGALSGPCHDVLVRLLSPYATAIQCRYRQKKAKKIVARRRKEYTAWCLREEERKKKLARRKANLEYRERQRLEALAAQERQQKIKDMKLRKKILQELVACFADPKWDEINRLLTVGRPLLGDDHELIVRATKIAKVLEKEWLHYNRNKERIRIKKRAAARKYESIEVELDREFVNGNLQIVPDPPTSPVNVPDAPPEDGGDNQKKGSSPSSNSPPQSLSKSKKKRNSKASPSRTARSPSRKTRRSGSLKKHEVASSHPGDESRRILEPDGKLST